MATVKSYTDLQQSKVLAKILPLESADMEYLSIKENGLLIGDVPFVKDDSEVEDSVYSHIYDRITCWSLAALLGVMICPKLEVYIEGVWDLIAFTDNTLKTPIEIQDCKDPIDACYEMIIKLHERKLL